MFDDLSVRDNLTLMRAERGLGRVRAAVRALPDPRAPPRPACRHALGRREEDPVVRAWPLRGAAAALLDEPSEGVQWENIVHMAELIGASEVAGIALVVVEQNLAFAELIADRYLVIEQGTVALEGGCAEIGREQLLAHLHV